MRYQDLLPIQNYIGGEWCPAVSGETFDKIEPATGKKYTTLPRSQRQDVQRAVEAARLAFPAWSRLTANERAHYLRRLAELIEKNLEVLALAESVDNGKPLSVAKNVDIPRSATNFRFFADAITQFSGESFATQTDTINYVVHQPLGVVACISPWNLPLYLFTWKIAPALAAGNCVVAKPSEVTPLTAYLLSHLCQEAGLPPGVLNILHGDGAGVGEPLVSHPDIKAISFTGSTLTGKRIADATVGQFKKLALEMGGKNPALVFADCDFEKTADELVRAAFSNQGQICLCASRIYIEETIYDKMKAALLERVSKLRQGDPQDSATQQGAVVSKAHHEKIIEALATAKKEGGRVLCGGTVPSIAGRCAQGYFVAPTLIEGLPTSSQTNQTEIFGPVATLIPFKDEVDALRQANDSTYGLAASLWTRDLARTHRMAQRLEFGIVWINTWMNRDLRTPFGGTKNSGLGREGGMEALRFFTEPKTICIHYPGGPA